MTDYNAAIDKAIADAVAEVNFQVEGKARAAVEEIAREVAREEIASLCGLVLRRIQDDDDAPTAFRLASIFGEALNDFTTETEPGT